MKAIILGMALSLTAQSAPLQLPLKQKFTEASGVTWLHLNGHPMSRRYNFSPGPDRHCTLNAYKYRCAGRPCAGEDLLRLQISFWDPGMSEDDGVMHNYIDFAWSDVATVNPFDGEIPWTSVSSGGKNTLEVSYPEKNTILLFNQNKFMFYTYTWAKIVTNDARDKVESIQLSYDYSDKRDEADRWTVLECRNK